ncbi:MAG: YraN family protein [Magnetospirillum sp.]|nr:YraN family protein [Magnetospirillum sp.]
MTRQAARQRGRFAEVLAVLLLRLKGFSILDRGMVSGRGSGAGEVDIVARRGRVLAFVEVKARPSTAEAAEAISARQRRRIVRGAEAFLARRPELAGLDIRFDAVLVAPGRWPRHVIAAWWPEGRRDGRMDA